MVLIMHSLIFISHYEFLIEVNAFYNFHAYFHNQIKLNIPKNNQINK